MSDDVLGEVEALRELARALHERAGALWTAYPVVSLDGVRLLRDDLAYRLGDLDAYVEQHGR